MIPNGKFAAMWRICSCCSLRECSLKWSLGFPRIQNGENLIREIVEKRGTEKRPIIVMTGHGTNAPKLAVQMMKLGVNDYVTKPFETSEGNALDKAIKEAVFGQTRTPEADVPKTASLAPVSQGVFTGGEMVFVPERVELLGQKICGGRQNGLIRGILDILREKKANGSYVALSGLELAEKLGCPGEQNKISSCIGRFRRSVAEVLMAEMGLKCGSQDVVQSGDQGYRLHESIALLSGHKLNNTNWLGRQVFSFCEIFDVSACWIGTFSKSEMPRICRI
jgi:hypothetical protein